MDHQNFILEHNAVMQLYSPDIAAYCVPFTCEDSDLDESFSNDAFRSFDNKTGCRFIVVDDYNNESTLHFYEKNGFKTLYKTEEEERSFLDLNQEEPLETRFMFFDLKNK